MYWEADQVHCCVVVLVWNHHNAIHMYQISADGYFTESVYLATPQNRRTRSQPAARINK
ncbi:uncharacterized protein EI97DRAFT_434627 [Westerdykella ornata]|uniref:Uncharacterized protein n=1 Tax=Westerdykella ornata TaxID=318751 RepID=A0A6A6JFS1_WESOR|nr:uncharacterized protein EI97DRAFT_434627 [Westerdykella ornata]KAF2275064.1 hypothetical protein EI97DRAFT_434627 [Westerdykella ornata]